MNAGPVNDRALVALGLLLGVGTGKKPAEWLSSAHELIRKKQAAEPMSSTVTAVLLGAVAFYAAERGRNPKVKTFYDALVYVSTNLSVGYSDIFAQTPIGKTIGSALMTYGPALATRVFDPPNEATARAKEAEQNQAALSSIADKLDKILVELRAERASRT
jgi:hypothetical protein